MDTKTFEEFQRNGAECRSKLRSLRARREDAFGRFINLAGHQKKGDNESVRGQICLPCLLKNEVNKKRPRTIETLENATFGEGQLAVEAVALRRDGS